MLMADAAVQGGSSMQGTHATTLGESTLAGDFCLIRDSLAIEVVISVLMAGKTTPRMCSRGSTGKAREGKRREAHYRM